MHAPVDLNQLSEAQLRQMAAQMLTRLNEQDAQLIERDEAIRRYRIRNEQLTHEIALLKRHRFGKRSEGINRQQYNLLEDLVDEDTAAIEQELERLAERQLMPERAADQLWNAYQVYRGVVHRRALQEQGSVVPAERLVEERAMVHDIWLDVFGEDAEPVADEGS